MKSELKTMKDELGRITSAQAECLTGWGFVKNEYRYRYQMLEQAKRSFQNTIAWMESRFPA